MDLVTPMHLDMRHLGLHAAAALMTLLGVLCVLTGGAAALLVDGLLSLPAAGVAAAATFQALRRPVGRTAGRLLDR
jgi:hypothetical protein